MHFRVADGTRTEYANGVYDDTTTDSIPGDYDGVMGVPISFLNKYCPEQFEIVGVANF